MDMYDSLFSQSGMLNEQLARHLFDIIGDFSPVIVIMDKEGNRWQSNSEQFHALNISESFLTELCAKIDDGAEPVVTQLGDCSLIAAQLSTDRTNCGYVILALPKQDPELTLANIDLVEIILAQTNLIAKLIEKNNHLYEIQTKMHSRLSSSN